MLIPPGIDFLYKENEDKNRYELKLFRAINHEKHETYKSLLSVEDSKEISELIKKYDGLKPEFMKEVNLGRRTLATKKAVFFTLALLILVFFGVENILSIFNHSLTGLFDKMGKDEKDQTSSCGLLAGIFLLSGALLIPACKGFIKESLKTKISFFSSDTGNEINESDSRFSWRCCFI